MPLQTYDSQDAVPEAQRESAIETLAGKWAVAEPVENKDSETLVKVRAEKKEVEKALKAATEKAAEVQRQLDAKEATGADTDKKVSDMLKKWEADKDVAVKAVQDELDKSNAKLREVTLYDKAKQAFVDAGGRAERADAALKLKKDFLDLAEDRPVVKNEKGEVTTTSIADFWGKDFKKEMPEYFTGTKAGGGGAAGAMNGKIDDSKKGDVDLVINNPTEALIRANAA